MAKDLLGTPAYFTERRNADGSLRFYWAASARIAAALAGGPHRVTVPLGKDRGAAERRCREITGQVEAWIAAEQRIGPPAKTGRTLADVIADFRKDPSYLERAHDTQRQYDWMLGRIEKWGGGGRIEHITYEVVRDAANALQGQLRTREVFLTVLAMLVDYSQIGRHQPGAVVINPARRVLAKVERPEAKGGWVWPREAVAAFARAADALGRCSIGTAVILNEWLAQRTADILTLPRHAYRDGVLHVVQSKTGQYVPLPLDLVAALRDRLEWQFALEAKRAVQELRPRTLLVCETTRAPWKIDHFRHEFARIRAALGGEGQPADMRALERAEVWPMGAFVLDVIPRRIWESMRERQASVLVRTGELLFAHLRHTGITRLHQAGCSDEEIFAISGHERPKTAYKHYIAVSIGRAAAAFQRREEFERGAQ